MTTYPKRYNTNFRYNREDDKVEELPHPSTGEPKIEILHSDPPQLRVNGTIIPWPEGKTQQEAYQDYLTGNQQQMPRPNSADQSSDSHKVPLLQSNNQPETLHPLRQQHLEDRLKELEYLERQHTRQDSFTTRMYGKKDYSKERDEIQQELRSTRRQPENQESKLPNWKGLTALQEGKQSLSSQSPVERFWNITDEQTAQEDYPNTPSAVGKEISRYKRENPDEYASYFKKWQDDQKNWQEIDQDIKDGTLSKQDISSAQWDTILSASRQELQDKQDPQKNTGQKPYCNIYARDRLLNKGIYMEPGKNANQMIEAMDKKGSGWEKLPKKTDAEGNPTDKLDHQEAQRRAEAGGTVVAVYHNPNDAEHGHIVLVNAEEGMKQSGKWGGEVPSVDGYNTNTKRITEGGSLSEQFSTPREPDMDYYEYTGPKREIQKE